MTICDAVQRGTVQFNKVPIGQSHSHICISPTMHLLVRPYCNTLSRRDMVDRSPLCACRIGLILLPARNIPNSVPPQSAQCKDAHVT